MKQKIGNNIEGCLIITIQLHLLNFTKFLLLKELFNPHKFTSGQSHRSIFNFCIGLGKSIMLLDLPGDNISSNEYII